MLYNRCCTTSVPSIICFVVRCVSVIKIFSIFGYRKVIIWRVDLQEAAAASFTVISGLLGKRAVLSAVISGNSWRKNQYLSLLWTINLCFCFEKNLSVPFLEAGLKVLEAQNSKGAAWAQCLSYPAETDLEIPPWDLEVMKQLAVNNRSNSCFAAFVRSCLWIIISLFILPQRWRHNT